MEIGNTHTNIDRESFGVPLDGEEEEEAMESESGREESLEINKDIAAAAQRERDVEVDERGEWVAGYTPHII